MGTLGLEGVSGNGRRECLRAIARVFFWQAAQMETEKCVGRNYWGHVSSAENNKSNKEIKGKQAQFKFTLWSRKSPSQSKKE